MQPCFTLFNFKVIAPACDSEQVVKEVQSMYAYIFRSGFWRKQFARPSQCSKFHSIAHPLNAANEFMEKRQLYLDLCGLSSSFASTALCFSSKGDSLLKLTVRSFSAEMLKEEDADDINDDKASAPKLGI